MKKIAILSISFILLMSISCKRKKYTEIVDVPLPAKEEGFKSGNPKDVKADKGSFSLYKLPFKYSELDPTIDAFTMEMHYSRHYLNYTNALNKIVEAQEKEDLSIEEIFKKLNLNDTELRNNAGGYYNHTLYFEILKPNGSSKPKDTLAATINRDFGSYDNMKQELISKANNQFGSGWAWLVVNRTGKLQVTSTPNQDNPLMPRQDVSGIPILAIDVWEHAYYLGYQNQRKKYLDNFFKVIDWRKVEEKFVAAIKR